MKRKCREGNSRERKLTWLVLGALILGGGTLFSSSAAEAAEVVINDGPHSVVTGNNDTGSTSGNHLTINSGATVENMVAGGNTDSGDANSNTVTINGGTLTTANIYGGRAPHGSASSNTVNINAGVSVGGIYVGYGSGDTGNTLNLNATGINVGSAGINYTQKIAILSGVGFDTSKTVLTSTGEIKRHAAWYDFSLDLSGATGLTDSTTVGTMTLISSNLAFGNSINKVIDANGTSKDLTTSNTTVSTPSGSYTPTGGNGAALTYTSTHNVKYANSNKQIDYTIATAVTGVNLTGWDSTKAAFAVPTGWTNSSSAISVTGTFATPSLAAGTSKDIVTAGANFFSSVSINDAIKYKDVGDLTNDTANGVTLSGDIYRGVKVTADGTSANAKLTYFADTKRPTSIVLGDMTWDTGRAMSTGYDFSGVTSITATGLNFSNPTAVTGSMTLLSNATGLTAGDGINHSQTFSTTAANGATLNATLNGNVTRGASALGYTATGTTLNSINLGNWTGTAGTLPTGWTKPTTGGVAVETGNFSVTPTSNIDIFTTDTANFFGSVTGDRAYSAAGEAFSIKDKGVILSGNKAGGVKATNNGAIANAKLTYFAEVLDVDSVSFGNMTWGTPREATSSYTFERVTNLNASGLNFTQGKATALDASTNLLTGATNLFSVKPVSITQPTNASVAVEYTETQGIKFSGTSTSGTVAMGTGTDADKVKYTITGGTMTGIDLGGWDGTLNRTVASFIPAGTTWTGSGVAVNTGNFTVTPATGNILTAEAGFFGTVTGDKAYSSGEAYTATDKGVTLTGTKAGGVKVEDSGATLKYYAEQRDNTGVALGTMTWGDGLTAPASYDFANTTSVDATNLKFTFTGTDANTIKATDTMDLLSNAANLANGLPVTGSPHNQAVSYDVANVAKLSGTLSGAITTTGNTIHYTVTDKTLDSVDFSAWNGTASEALDASWTKNASGISVTGSGFTAPTAVLDHTILTASDGFFTNAKIDASIAYQPSGAYSETESNITLSGKQAKGVRAVNNGQALAYSVGEAFIDNLALGAVSYSKGATLLDKSDAFYNFSNLNQIDTTGFSVTMTDDQKKRRRPTTP